MANLYGDLPEGYVELRLKENGAKGKMLKRVFAGTHDKVAAFVDKYADRTSKSAIYYGVGKRREQTDGTKANVLGCTSLWADVDVVKQGWDMEATVRALYRLPGCLQPSGLVFSGGGVHAYWMLKEPAIFDISNPGRWNESVARFENANKEMQRLVSSDRVFDISRVLRMPGAYHTKGKAQLVESIFFFRWHKTNVSDLADAARDYGKVLGPDGFVHPSKLPVPANAKVDPMRAFEIAFNFHGKSGRAKQYEDIWDRCRVGGAPPYIGIDEAVLLATANLHVECPDALDDTIINKVMSSAIEVQSRDAGLGDWQWSEEKQRAFIADKLERFKKKWVTQRVILKRKRREELKAAKEKIGVAADQNNKRG